VNIKGRKARACLQGCLPPHKKKNEGTIRKDFKLFKNSNGSHLWDLCKSKPGRGESMAEN